MRKRLLLLLSLIFLLCGCTAEVNITISDSSIEESVAITVMADNTTSKSMIKDGFRVNMPAFEYDMVVDTEPDTKKPNVSYYYYDSEDLGNGYKNTYTYNYNFDDFKNSRSVKEAFRSVTIQNDRVDREIMVSTDNGGVLFFNAYPKLETIKVNIKSDYRVKETNADSHKDNVYTWVFTPTNDKKGIYLLLDKNHKWDEKDPEPEDPSKPGPTDPSDPGKKDPSQNNPSKKKTEEEKKDNKLLIIIIGVVGALVLIWLLSKVKIVKEK